MPRLGFHCPVFTVDHEFVRMQNKDLRNPTVRITSEAGCCLPELLFSGSLMSPGSPNGALCAGAQFVAFSS